jgi:hypothetical protein
MTPKILALKILDQEMNSCNGGNLHYELNKLYTIKGQIKICQNGIHLTYRPDKWEGTRIFIAETRTKIEEEDDKFVCRSAKLLKELTPEQLKKYKEGKASLLNTYEEGEASLWKTYEEGKAPLLKTYEEGKAPLWKTYKEGKAPLWKTYEEEIQKILKSFLDD